MTDEQNVVALHSAKTSDTEKAADYKERVSKILGDLMSVMREAERGDFRIDFQISRDSIGMPYFVGPTISKRF
jgi:hypothetical protein